jgi:hypothetical protein
LQAKGAENAASLRRYLDGPMDEKRFGGMVSEWEDYCRLFRGVNGERAIGEASPCYLWSQTAAANIAEFAPHARIIVILRNPVERAYSEHLVSVHAGDLKWSFEQHVRAAMAQPMTSSMSILHPFLEFGLYAEQVRRYMERFPADQIGLWLYEETLKPNFLSDVYRFLGVDCTFKPDTRTRYLEQQIAKVPAANLVGRKSGAGRMLRQIVPATLRSWARKLMYRSSGAMQMTQVERRLLIEYYCEDILRLEVVLQRSLSSWLV